jgi:small conductance mechanosensitive channel
MLPQIALPTTLPSAAAMPATVKAALPAITVMLVNGAKDLLLATLILIAGWTVARWVGRWAHDVIDRSHHVDATLKPLVANFAQYLIIAITVIVVLGQFGVQTTSLIALLGAAGLAVGLALQGTLSNVASGVMLLFLRPFRVNEKIRFSDAVGTVREIGLFRTSIVTDDGLFVSVPNATIFSGTITNTSREAMRRANFVVEVDRAEDIDTVQKTILEALQQEPRILKTPAATVEVETLGPLSTTLTVQAWLQNRDFGGVQSDLKKRVRHALEGASVSAPVPVPAPAVAPWTPEPEKPAANQRDKPN